MSSNNNSEDSLKCKYCDGVFETYNSLKSHRLRKHKDQFDLDKFNKGDHECDRCKRKFTQKSNLCTHRKTCQGIQAAQPISNDVNVVTAPLEDAKDEDMQKAPFYKTEATQLNHQQTAVKQQNQKNNISNKNGSVIDNSIPSKYEETRDSPTSKKKVKDKVLEAKKMRRLIEVVLSEEIFAHLQINQVIHLERLTDMIMDLEGEAIIDYLAATEMVAAMEHRGDLKGRSIWGGHSKYSGNIEKRRGLLRKYLKMVCKVAPCTFALVTSKYIKKRVMPSQQQQFRKRVNSEEEIRVGGSNYNAFGYIGRTTLDLLDPLYQRNPLAPKSSSCKKNADLANKGGETSNKNTKKYHKQREETVKGFLLLNATLSMEVLADNFKEESKSNGYDTCVAEATQATVATSKSSNLKQAKATTAGASLTVNDDKGNIDTGTGVGDSLLGKRKVPESEEDVVMILQRDTQVYSLDSELHQSQVDKVPFVVSVRLQKELNAIKSRKKRTKAQREKDQIIVDRFGWSSVQKQQADEQVESLSQFMNEAYQSVTHQVIENKRRKFDKVDAADINIVTTGSEASQFVIMKEEEKITDQTRFFGEQSQMAMIEIDKCISRSFRNCTVGDFSVHPSTVDLKPVAIQARETTVKSFVEKCSHCKAASKSFSAFRYNRDIESYWIMMKFAQLSLMDCAEYLVELGITDFQARSTTFHIDTRSTRSPSSKFYDNFKRHYLHRTHFLKVLDTLSKKVSSSKSLLVGLDTETPSISSSKLAIQERTTIEQMKAFLDNSAAGTGRLIIALVDFVYIPDDRPPRDPTTKFEGHYIIVVRIQDNMVSFIDPVETTIQHTVVTHFNAARQAINVDQSCIFISYPLKCCSNSSAAVNSPSKSSNLAYAKATTMKK